MKTITPYLVRFAFVASALTLAFRYCLSYGIDNEMLLVILLSAILYGMGMFSLGWYFGKKDGRQSKIRDIGFRIHLTTYILYNLISELWFILGLNSDKETIGRVHTTAICWAIFLLVHFLFYLWLRKKPVQ